MTIRQTTVILAVALTMAGCRKGKHPARAQQAPPTVSRIEIDSLQHPERLLRGFSAGTAYWRWTHPVFAVALDAPWTAGSPTYVEMGFWLPGESKQSKDAIVTVRANGVEICKKTYPQAGESRLTCPVPAQALVKRPVEVEVETANASYRDPATGEEKSLIFQSMALEEYEATLDFQQSHAERAREGFDKVAAHWKPLPAKRVREMTGLLFWNPVPMNTYFQGVPMAKIPLDSWVMQEIIYETKPEFVIEAGTWQGGSALYFASLFKTLGLPGRVLTVDIEDVHRPAATHALWKQYVDFYLGSSVDPALVAKIADRVRGHRVFVSLDSAHEMLHVLKELRMYGPLVQPGCYLVVEDTDLDGVPTIEHLTTGPMAAVERFLETDGAGFEPDYSREILLSQNPGGWLKRK